MDSLRAYVRTVETGDGLPAYTVGMIFQRSGNALKIKLEHCHVVFELYKKMGWRV
jgi:hypothetical protein